MKSSLPKLLHQACGRTLLDWTLRAVAEFDPQRVVVVVPPDDPELVASLPEWAAAAVQPVARGPATRCPVPARRWRGSRASWSCSNADHPLTDPQSLRDLVAAHTEADARASVIALRPHRRDRRGLWPHRARARRRVRADRGGARRHRRAARHHRGQHRHLRVRRGLALAGAGAARLRQRPGRAVSHRRDRDPARRRRPGDRPHPRRPHHRGRGQPPRRPGGGCAAAARRASTTATCWPGSP